MSPSDIVSCPFCGSTEPGITLESIIEAHGDESTEETEGSE